MILDVLLVIGALISLLSGIDLVIRPHQRKQVQSFLEEITLSAADLNPADFRKRIQEPGVQAVLVMVTYFELALVTVAALLIQAPQWKPGGALHGAFGAQGQMVQALGVLASVATLFFAWRWPLPQIMRWILGGSTRWAVRRRFVGSVALGYLFFGAYQALAVWLIAGESFFGGIIHQEGSPEQAAFMWSLLPVWPLFIVFWVVFQGTGLALQPGSWMTRGLFGLFKATMWRLVEYNKGAVAAIALLLTIVLSILKLQLS